MVDGEIDPLLPEDNAAASKRLFEVLHSALGQVLQRPEYRDPKFVCVIVPATGVPTCGQFDTFEAMRDHIRSLYSKDLFIIPMVGEMLGITSKSHCLRDLSGNLHPLIAAAEDDEPVFGQRLVRDSLETLRDELLPSPDVSVHDELPVDEADEAEEEEADDEEEADVGNDEDDLNQGFPDEDPSEQD